MDTSTRAWHVCICLCAVAILLSVFSACSEPGSSGLADGVAIDGTNAPDGQVSNDQDTRSSDSTCQTNCADKECGDNGCGGSCGSCAGSTPFCKEGICVSTCEPDCLGKECGDDGCGDSCGTCGEEYACDHGVCRFIPWCQDGECGEEESCWTCPDDCGACCGNGICEPVYGETCGTCVTDCGCECGEICDAGLCVFMACADLECGGNGCGGSCGTCPTHYECDSGLCQYIPWCGDEECNGDEQCDICPADCGLCCGDGWCTAEDGEDCISCPADCSCDCGEECQEGTCVFTTCEGLECGDDGCGGSCGDCDEHYACESGICLFIPWCGDATCDSGESCSICALDCGECCGNGECEPLFGETCSACQTDCGCGCGESCNAGTCYFSACDDSECGEDGCGGSCGVCSGSQELCLGGLCLCQSMCDGKECGNDGCGDICGECPAHYGCEEGTCIYIPWCGDDGCNGEESCWNCPADCDACCGNGACEPGYEESCLTCVADCACACGELCQQGSCLFTACEGKECGADGCGGSCGTCDEDHHECLDGLCQYIPWCGDEECNGDEQCDICPADCGLCCGDGWCTAEDGEDCDTCPSDCACFVCGETCEEGVCVFTACDGMDCGDDTCGGFCGTCGPSEICDESTYVCASIPDCTNGMCRVPAGEFEMGCDWGACNDDQSPVHYPYLDEYYIDQFEVTNDDYAEFLNWLEEQNHSNECEVGDQWLLCIGDSYDEIGLHQVGGVWTAKEGKADLPMVRVFWSGAYAFCQWKGKRLPTEAEWEKSARSNNGRRFPWGNTTITCEVAVGNEGGNAYGCGTGEPWPVGSKSPQGDSPYGVSDLSGNVWEWVADWYSPDYYESSPGENPQGPEGGTERVKRGGSYKDVLALVIVSATSPF